MSPLSKEERSKNICWICENIGVDIKKDDLEWLSESTAGFTFGDLNSVIAVSVRLVIFSFLEKRIICW